MENETLPALPGEAEDLMALPELPDPFAPKPAATGIGANLAELPGQIVRGVAEGLNAANSGTHDLGVWLNDNIVDLGSLHFGEEAQGDVGMKGWLTWSPGVENTSAAQIPDSVLPAKPETVVGSIANDAAQLGVGLIGAGKFLKLGKAAGVVGSLVRGAVTGAVADFSVFDGNDERLSNFVQKYPSLQNPVTEFLAANEDDNEALGRLKNAAEGVVIGTALEALLYSVRVAKAWGKGDKDGAEKVLDEVDAASDAAKAEVKNQAVDPLADQPLPPKVDDPQLDMFPEAKPGEAPVDATAPVAKEAFKTDETGQLDMGLEGSRSPDSANTTLDENVTATLPQGGKKPVGMKPVKKLVEVDDEGFKKILEDRDWQENSLFPEARDISGIRTDLIENGDDIQGILDTLSRVYSEQMQKARGGNAEGVRTWDVVKLNAGRIADTVGGDSQMIMQRMAAQHKNLFQIDAELRAYGDFLATVGQKVYDLSEFVANPGGALPAKYATRNDMMADFAKHYELMANAQAMYRGMQTNTARALNAFKIGSRVNQGMLGHMNPDDLFAGGPAAMEKLAKQIKGTGGDLKSIAMTTKVGLLKKFIGAGQEMWINGLLSGPKTHIVNTLSSMANAVFAPTEKLLSGALRSGTKQGRQDFVEAGAEYAGLVMSIKDSLSLAARAFKEGNAVLDPMKNSVDDIPNFISASSFGLEGDAIPGRFAEALGVFLRLPSRLLMAEDEFVKQMSYRSQVRARAIREHLMRDGATDTTSLADRIASKLDASMDETGRGIDEIALDQARRATFSNDLKAETRYGGRTIGETLQTAANNHPALRMVVPFIRTPTNIARFVWQRTPGFNMLRKNGFEDFVGKNGPKAQADFLSRTTIGGGMWAMAAHMAYEGTITGGGPADADMRRALEATGWKPYSWKTTNQDTGKVEYTQFTRADPIATFFGLAADFAEAAGHVGQDSLEEHATNLTMALARNLQNKTYMSGLTHAIEALANPERRIGPFARNMAATMVPYNALLSQSVNTDPHMRDARTMIDAMRAKVPYLSEKVDPMRNIFGEKVMQSPAWGPDWLSPFATGIEPHIAGTQPVTKDWQLTPQKNETDELSRLAYVADSSLRPTGPELGGVDLTKWKHPNGVHTAADRYAELIGTVTQDGMTLRQQLRELINTEMYAEATDGDAMHDGSRIELVRRVLGGYRQLAQAALFEENPEIEHAWEAAKYDAAVAKGAAKEPPPQPTASSQLPGLPPAR